MVDKTLTVDLIPQGSLAEMIRAGGAGLGGVLTPTGVGTIVEDSPFCLGKQTIDGKEYLLMKPLRADFALLNGHMIDKFGNIWYKGTTRNFNIVMATAADVVIARRTTWWRSATSSPRTWSPPAPLSTTSWMEGMCNG